MIGIYKATNIINGKVYIGQSKDIYKRWNDHRTRPFNPNRDDYNCVFYRAIRKYGIDNFNFEVIEKCSEIELNTKEKYWIKEYNSFIGFENCNGYNMTLGGDSVSNFILQYKEVQEIYDLLSNSNLTQREIANKFNVAESTISGINKGDIWFNEYLIYPLRHNIITKHFCKNCGKHISHDAVYCRECYIEIQHQEFVNSIPLTKEELQQLLFNNKGNFTKVSQQFGINTTKLRRWCKELNLSPYSDSYKPQKTEKKTIKDYQKSVRMLDKNTLEPLQEFESLREAMNFLGKTGSSCHISDAAKGIRKTAYGYKWEFI